MSHAQVQRQSHNSKSRPRVETTRSTRTRRVSTTAVWWPLSRMPTDRRLGLRQRARKLHGTWLAVNLQREEIGTSPRRPLTDSTTVSRRCSFRSWHFFLACLLLFSHSFLYKYFSCSGGWVADWPMTCMESKLHATRRIASHCVTEVRQDNVKCQQSCIPVVPTCAVVLFVVFTGFLHL